MWANCDFYKIMFTWERLSRLPYKHTTFLCHDRTIDRECLNRYRCVVTSRSLHKSGNFCYLCGNISLLFPAAFLGEAHAIPGIGSTAVGTRGAFFFRPSCWILPRRRNGKSD
ncbi:hypothetical protein CEXT_661351 [Caerostris extrusa]|uniref:Uncharacterized protein n=1 Tax=Caerostris extrusa TaxID=172846 RepID=A0AAV4Q3N3_CAEEX|nr:hypothetical protein CEXT_661351 [Caerostris extrusa]